MAQIYFWGCLIEMIKVLSLSSLLGCGFLLIVSTFINHVAFYWIGATGFVIFILAEIVSQILSKQKISPVGKAVLITGCDRGFGHMLACSLDNLGFTVFAGCLFPDGEGANILRKVGSHRLHVLALDVTDDSSIQGALTYVEENLKQCKLWAIVNNAGIIDGGEVCWTDVETVQRLIDVNTIGVFRVTKTFLPMIQKSKGRILVVSSAAGRSHFPYLGPYCISKRATTSFCDSLRQEMSNWDIPVITIEPEIHRTALVTDHVTNFKRSWERAPKEVKEMYDSHYIDKVMKFLCFISQYLSNNPRGVVSAMENGIMTVHPECTYAVGCLTTRLFTRCSETFPKSVVTTVTHLVLKLHQELQ